MFRCFDLATPLQTCMRSMRLCLHSEVTEEEKKAKSQSANIDRYLFEQAQHEMNVVKILMQGAAESGKSTLVKQMKMIHSRGFTKQELISFKPAVLDNLLTSMKFVLQGMGTLRINLANRKNKVHARSILSCERCVGDDSELLPFVALAFCSLWADQGVRAATSRGHEFQLNDSALYFFENMSRIIAPNYIPTESDVLRVRVRTSGILETQFRINNLLIRLYDVGGQRTEQRKWLSCFDSVRAVLFVVALSGYDMNLVEDPSKILFMNKMDLFREKILRSGRHLRLYLSDFKGPDCDVNAAACHITSVFAACNTNPCKQVYHHFTNATDPSNVQVVFQVVINTIIKENLEAVSLL